MSNRKSEHWIHGGTGLTNFPPEQFQIYNEAVRRFGNNKLEVSTERMTGRGESSSGGSLHYLGDIKSVTGAQEISAFWKVFQIVNEASKEIR